MTRYQVLREETYINMTNINSEQVYCHINLKICIVHGSTNPLAQGKWKTAVQNKNCSVQFIVI